jgi:hypothetical protein
MAVAIQPAMPRPNTSSPVPIAAARPQPRRRVSGKENLVQFKPPTIASITSVTSVASVTAVGLASIRPRRERPCDACRRRQSRCVIHEGATICVLCEFHKQDCTFVQDPQPRKRKIPSAAAGEQKDLDQQLGSKKR